MRTLALAACVALATIVGAQEQNGYFAKLLDL